MGYITYETFKQCGGTSSESAFSILIIDAEARLNFITNGKLDSFIKRTGIVPEEVKRLETVVIDRLQVEQNTLQDNSAVTSYSNGIETISYKDRTRQSLNNDISALVQQYLWQYPEITYRGVL